MEENPLLTSHCDAETIERAKSAGVMAFLLKPLREEELLPTIQGDLDEEAGAVGGRGPFFDSEKEHGYA